MLNGSIVALITPFKKNGNVDFEKLSELIEFQAQNGTSGLLILGTTSESPTLSEHEKDQIVSYVIHQNNHRMDIMVGVTSNATAIACEKAKKYEALGADYLLVISPFYNKTNEEGLYEHFKTIALSVHIPIVLYNIPGRTGICIPPSVMERLKEIKNIYGVKEACKDINHILEVNRMCDENFHLFCGNDDLILIFLRLNATGIITVYGNINPKWVKEIFEIKDEAEQNKRFNLYYPFLNALFIETNPIPIKSMMHALGMIELKFRLPLVPMEKSNEEILYREYAKIGNRFHSLL